MFKKLRFVVLVTLIFGSASTALAASNGTETHRSHPVRPGLLVTGWLPLLRTAPGRPIAVAPGAALSSTANPVQAVWTRAAICAGR